MVARECAVAGHQAEGVPARSALKTGQNVAGDFDWRRKRLNAIKRHAAVSRHHEGCFASYVSKRRVAHRVQPALELVDDSEGSRCA